MRLPTSATAALGLAAAFASFGTLGMPGCEARSAEAVPANVQTVELTLEGMHCDSCVAAIRAGVSDLDGVVDCTVTLEPQHLVARVSDAEARQRIADKVRRMGYTVVETAAEPAPANPG